MASRSTKSVAGATKMLVVPVMALLAVVAAFAASAPTANSRLLATCTPQADLPFVQNGSGYGDGTVNCDAGAPTWQYTIRLTNRAGNILAQTSGGPVSGGAFVNTAIVGCSGAIVHSFLYINVGGAGKSDTSGEVGC